MVRLRRTGVRQPKGWKKRVEKALGDHKGFERKARAFEKLALIGKKRQAGFKAYGCAVLAGCGGDFPAVWRKSKALKEALRNMTDGHCAYCQKGIEKGHVDHVQPKSLFPLLTYRVRNYLYACARCNEAKSNNWPAKGGYVRPDRVDPAGRFVFHDDGRVEAAPRDKRAKETVDGIRLDRVGLRKLRKVAIEQALKTLLPVLTTPGLPDAFRLAQARLHLLPALSPYSEAVNQSVRRAWAARFPGVAL